MAREYVRICKIIPTPNVSKITPEIRFKKILPYLRQKIKMWGYGAFTASNILRLMMKPMSASFIENPDPFKDEPFSNNRSENQHLFDLNDSNENKNPLARIDCITCLLSTVDCTVAQDILQIMAKFPIALPLVIPDFEYEKYMILNQLMAVEHMFSLIGEPGASRGKPYTLSGTIKFIWLTQETCSDSFWSNVMEPYYKKGANEIVLLANLLGDALEYEEQIQWLKQATSKFFVFIMPNAGEKKWKRLKEIVDYERVEYFTIQKVLDLKTEFLLDLDKFISGNPLKSVKRIECNESQCIIDFIKKYSCAATKNFMRLRNQHIKIIGDNQDLWKNNKPLQALMKHFGAVMSLQIEKRRRALIHLERYLSNISAEESSKARENALELVDNKNLGLEYFFREIGQIYELIFNKPNHISQFPKSCAELFIEGQVIELIDRDSSKMSGAWLFSIFKEISMEYPDLRVFVISILGLQSSEKLLFLESKLCKELNVDAILLIDTEGLCAPEKINKKDALQKNWLLATFVMGISNLTLLNVLGEYMNNLTEILQIAIVAMAHLEKAEIVPDIFMVQYLSERNMAKTSSGEIQFCEALQKAFKIADQHDAELGITNANCLKILNKRIQKGELLYQFHSFRNGASTYAPPSDQYHEDVTKLYEDILKAYKYSHSKVLFKKWYSVVNRFWESVKNEHFTVQFKNLTEIYDFIEHSRLIVKVKEAISATFQTYTKQCSDRIRRKTFDNSNTHSIREECIASIEEESDNDLSSDHCDECTKVSETRVELENYLKDKEEIYKLDTLNTIEKYIKSRRQAMKAQLIQIFEARLISEGCTTEFMDVITSCLKSELKRHPSRQFSEDDRNTIADDI
ncbi:38784_t:CDS:2 [Gigaspora margarita]|uniref:38784_t:CDS:1 n=1 Tax=Gigaspora margarita TaxID=4874 RepID=A0ABM8W734_GIGMA|nr:38784_t:CDS:2 [Gigaspora margarita]